MPDSLTNGDSNRRPVSHTLNRFQKCDTGKLLKTNGTQSHKLRQTDSGFGRNRLSRRGNCHLTGGRASCAICGLVPLRPQSHAFLCRSVDLAPPCATAVGRHAGTGRGRPPARPRRAPDPPRKDHARSTASKPHSALIGAEEARPTDGHTGLVGTIPPRFIVPEREDGPGRPVAIERRPQNAHCMLGRSIRSESPLTISLIWRWSSRTPAAKSAVKGSSVSPASPGQLAKTDTTDARTLALYAVMVRPEAKVPPTPLALGV